MLGRTMHRCLVGILSVGVLGVVLPTAGAAQPYDLLLAGGHVIDPKNGIDDVMDVAIADGTIARVASEIPATDAERVIDVSGLFVTPGLVDLHVHVFHGTDPGTAYSNGFNSISVDGFTLRTGVTGRARRTYHALRTGVAGRAAVSARSCDICVDRMNAYGHRLFADDFDAYPIAGEASGTTSHTPLAQGSEGRFKRQCGAGGAVRCGAHIDQGQSGVSPA